MTYNDIIAQIKSVSKDSIKLTDIEKKMLEEVIKAINEGLLTSGGKITGLSSSAGSLITKGIKNFYASKPYQNSVASLLRRIDDISANKSSLYKDANLDFSKSSVSQSQSLVINEMLDTLNESGLNSQFNQSLRKLIYDNVRLGTSQSTLEKTLKLQIESGKAPSKLANYINQTAVQAADAYSSIIDREVFKANKDKVTHYRIVGSLIDTSSKQCRRFVEEFDREIPVGKELNNFINYAIENGASPTLTADNLPVLKLHFGCRHSFVPIIKL